MRFTNANTVNRKPQGASRFGEAGRYSVGSNSRVSGRQSVNISQETMELVAKKKLGHVVVGKIAYNRLGAIGNEDTVGQHLSTRA